MTDEEIMRKINEYQWKAHELIEHIFVNLREDHKYIYSEDFDKKMTLWTMYIKNVDSLTNCKK
jgi:hypothetical protein